MELIGIEESKVIYLLDLFRPAGQIYSPEAAAKMGQRYSFARFPTLENLVKNERSFGVGKFNDIAINEFNVYSDGLIATSGSNTDKIDAFIDDLLAWAKEEFGLVQVAGHPPERSYESTVIIKADADLIRALAPKAEVAATLNRIYQSGTYDFSGPMQISGFVAATDRTQFEGRRKPISFTLDHRLGIPFEQNIFFSMAPFKTKDHLAVLRTLEDLALAL